MKTKLGVVLAFGIIALAFSCGKKAESTETTKDSTTTKVDTTAKAETPKDSTSNTK